MAKHLTTRDVEAILNIIYAHDDKKLTWEAICEESEAVVGKKPTRQSLYSNEMIREAYKTKKASLRQRELSKPKPSSLYAAAERISKLQSEVEMLKRKNDALLEKFVVWQYNAYKHGLTEQQMNEPLPKIDREIT
ncbi:hypothetical protein [Aliikangiella maris]|uniref:Uncharacterized protein n=2 Tax=Aliikangiella maris TaxID=3162458 RepID=A0ABV3MQU9_9GAMM